jgi:hypothetical protein
MGIAAALEAVDHQILYGRRGTGKTHALRFLQTLEKSRGDVALYFDLRTVGSPEGLFLGDVTSITERAARLLIDLLAQLHDGLLEAVLEDETMLADSALVAKLDALLSAITTIRVAGEVEISHEGERHEAESSTSALGVRLGSDASVEARLGTQSGTERRDLVREVRRGTEAFALNFSDIARSLRELASGLNGRRIWLLLDEWSSVPPDLQPLLGEFVVRCILPLSSFTVKIAAIEQQTNFRQRLQHGTNVGIEVGADVAANVDLDEFMVFEQHEERARDFFRGLLFKHLTSGVDSTELVPGLDSEADVVRVIFTDSRAFDELVRAAEGVPRDAINIAAKAGLRASDRLISVPDVRVAARGWYQTDKETALRGHEEAARLLNWIIDSVIRQKRSRGFLVNQRSSGVSLLQALFDARVLHIVRKGYSAQDAPGERFDVYVIDYGAYIDLIQTKNAPGGMLPCGEEGEEAWVDVPTQDLRSIRRSILDLDNFQLSLQ